MSTMLIEEVFGGVRVLGEIKVDEDGVEEEESETDIQDSDIEDEVDITNLCERNQSYCTAEMKKWTVDPYGLEGGDTIQLIVKPIASKMNYKLLHPLFYCDLKELGTLDNLATLVNAPTDWEARYDRVLARNETIGRSLNKLIALPEGTSEADVSCAFSHLVFAMAVILEVHVTARAETPIAVGGLLVDKKLFLRSNTDVNFSKDGRVVIATELKAAKAFSEGELWYRKSRGIQALAAMYAHRAPTFLASQKLWKLIVLNRTRNGIFTYPFETGVANRVGSTLTKGLGPTFLKALCICILSDPDGAAAQSETSTMNAGVVLSTPVATRRRQQGSAEQAPKKPRGAGDGGSKQLHNDDGASKRMLAGEAVHERVRVLSDSDVRSIEGRIAAAELARASALRAAETGSAF